MKTLSIHKWVRAMVFAGLTISCLTACHFDIDIPSSRTKIEYDNADQYTAGKATFDPTDIQKLDIEWLADSIVFRYGSGSQVEIDEYNSRPNDSTQLRWYLQGGSLYIKYCREGKVNTKNLKKVLYITWPQNVSLDQIDVESVSADFCFDSLTLREFSIETVSGDLKGNILHSRELSVETVSGDIKIGNLEAADVDLESVSGDFRLTVPDNFEAKFSTVSGNINTYNHAVTMQGKTYRCGNGEMEIDCETVSGDLKLQ